MIPKQVCFDMGDMMGKTKAEIIVHCMDFIDNKKEVDRNLAIEKLLNYAKFYRLSLRRRAGACPLPDVLRKFILNQTGYIETMIPLYSALMSMRGK